MNLLSIDYLAGVVCGFCFAWFILGWMSRKLVRHYREYITYLEATNERLSKERQNHD